MPVVILISGTGTNLQTIIDAAARGELPIEIRAVISNRPNAAGLQRARAAGIHTAVIDHTTFTTRSDFDAALRASIDTYQPQLVILAGFMRILTPDFVHHFEGRMLNIHPSLLPKFRGIDTHTRVLAAHERTHGASVHFVGTELDGGPVILQARVPVLEGDTPETLGARVLEREHAIYPQVIRWFAQGRLVLRDGLVYLDGSALTTPLLR